jgi:hypothetical protein
MVEQGRERGIDRGAFRIPRHVGHVNELDMGFGEVFGEMALDRGEVGQLFRIFTLARKIDRRFRSLGAPFLDGLLIAVHLEPRAKRFEVHVGKTRAVQLAQVTLEVVVVGRTEESSGHAANRDDGKISLGRFDLDGLRAVKFFALLAQKMADGALVGEPCATVFIDDIKRSLGLLGSGRQVNGVGGRVAQQDACDVEKAERLARLPDLGDHGFHRGRRGGKRDAQPRERIGRRRRGTLLLTGRTVELFAAGLGSAARASRFEPPLGTAAGPVGTRAARLGRGGRRG